MKKADALEFAILGILHEAPLHGYELRKRLSQVLGTFHAISFGSLYPALKALSAAGLVSEAATSEEEPELAPAGRGAMAKTAAASTRRGKATKAEPIARRSRITYSITAAGELRFATLLSESGPSAWDDDGFGVHFAFFGRADRNVRTNILEGRRMRLAERRALMRDSLTRTRERVDAYTLELQRHGLESVERELRWLDDLIEAEHNNP